MPLKRLEQTQSKAYGQNNECIVKTRIMLKNYLKIAWRNLLRNKSFSILNIVGLSIGLAVTALIVIWINFEIGIDQFHDNKDRTYQVYNQYPVDGEIWTWDSTPKIMASAIEKDYPEVEHITRVNWDSEFLFAKGDKRINGTGKIVDPDFLKIFSFPLLEGSLETVLDGVNSVIITESFAKKVFGNEQAVGKTVKVDDADSFMVTGILKDLPSNTAFEFDFLMPWAYLKQRGSDDKYWGNNSVATYVMLKKGVDYTLFSKKIKNLRKKYDKDSPEMVTYFIPIYTFLVVFKFRKWSRDRG